MPGHGRIPIQLMMAQKQKPKTYTLKDLPPQLRLKYNDCKLFKENRTVKKEFKFDLDALKRRKAEKQKTIEEKLEQFSLNSTEEKYLNTVFKNLSSLHDGQYFTSSDIETVLGKMGMKNKMGRKQIDLMIWEIDEKLDKKISQREFIQMYKKCVFDNTGIEPKKIFHLTQFLMYCRPNKYTITVEDTLELLFVRVKKEAEAKKINQKYRLQEQIRVIFGDEEKTADGIEIEVSFEEYLQKINRRAIQKRKQQSHKGKADKI